MGLKSATIKVYVYTGTSGSYSNGDLKYTLAKDKISTRSNVIFEIGNLVRDYIDVSFNDDYTSTTKWVTIVKTLIDEETGEEYDEGSPVTTHYILKDGYGDYEDEINPQTATHAMITANDIYLKEQQVSFNLCRRCR